MSFLHSLDRKFLCLSRLTLLAQLHSNRFVFETIDPQNRHAHIHRLDAHKPLTMMLSRRWRMETGSHVIFMELHFDDDNVSRSTCKPFKRHSASCTIPILNGCGSSVRTICVTVTYCEQCVIFISRERKTVNNINAVKIKTHNGATNNVCMLMGQKVLVSLTCHVLASFA